MKKPSMKNMPMKKPKKTLYMRAVEVTDKFPGYLVLVSPAQRRHTILNWLRGYRAGWSDARKQEDAIGPRVGEMLVRVRQ